MYDQSKTSAHNTHPSGRWVCGLVLVAMIVCGAMLFRSPTVAPLGNVVTKPTPAVSEPQVISANQPEISDEIIGEKLNSQFSFDPLAKALNRQTPNEMTKHLWYDRRFSINHPKQQPEIIPEPQRKLRPKVLNLHADDPRFHQIRWEWIWGRKWSDRSKNPHRVYGSVL